LFYAKSLPGATWAGTERSLLAFLALGQCQNLWEVDLGYAKSQEGHSI